MTFEYNFSRAAIRANKASGFKHGAIVTVDGFLIRILYRDSTTGYSTPAILSTVEDRTTHELLDFTPEIEGGYPGNIYDFLHR